MEYPGFLTPGVPVVLKPERPHRNWPRNASEHLSREQFYIEDADGRLVPAISQGTRIHRSSSASGSRTPVVIYNNRWDIRDKSYSSDDERDDHEHGRPRSRSRGRGHGHDHGHGHESPLPSPGDPDMDKKMAKLAELERKEEEEAARQRFEEKRILDEAKRVKEAKALEETKTKAIEEYNAKKLEEKMKKKKQKEEEDKAFQERLRVHLAQAGYSDESIEKTLQGKGEKNSEKKIVNLTRPTYIKVHRKYLSPDTLDLYELPWEWDDSDSSYIIIKRWIPQEDQDILFEHTRKLREGRMLTNTTLEIEKKRDNLLLVRKKSPSRRRSRSRSYIFT